MESLSVAAKLELESNVPQVISRMVDAFEKLNSEIKTTQDILARLGSKSGSVNGLGESLGRLSKIRMGVGLSDDLSSALTRTTEIADQTKVVADNAARAASAYRSMGSARVPGGPGGGNGGGGNRGGGGSRRGDVDPVNSAISAGIIGATGSKLAADAFMANAAIQQQIISIMANKNMTAGDLGQVTAAIAKLQKQYPALQTGDALNIYKANLGVFGDPDEALATLPGAVRLDQLYQSLTPAKGGTMGTPDSEVVAASRTGDAMQAFIDPKTGKIDAGLFDQWMQFQEKSMLAGGGTVDAKSFFTFAKTARTAGIGLDQQALEYTQALLELSPSRAGTSINSAFNLFGSGTSHMTDKTRAAWDKAGLIGKNGQIIDQALYQVDPYKWIWDDFVPKLAKMGIKTRAQLIAWISANGQRATVAGAIADIAIGKQNIQRTASRIDAQDPDAALKAMQASDIGKVQALAAAENSFMIALGGFESGPGIKLLTDVTSALNMMTASAEAHPKAAQAVVMVAGGLTALFVAAGALGVVVFVGSPVVKGVEALARAAGSLAKAVPVLEVAGEGLAEVATAITPFAAGGPVGVAMAALIGFLYGFPKAMDAVNGWLGVTEQKALRVPSPDLVPKGYVLPAHPSPPTQRNADGSIRRGGYGPHAEADIPADNAALAAWVRGGAVVTVGNPRDIANGTASFLKRQLGAPNTGPSGFNPRATPSGSAALAVGVG